MTGGIIMHIKKSIQTYAAEQSGMVAKAMSFHFLSAFMIGAQIFILFLSSKVSLFPSADALMSIVSTCAEIIAGLYGITLAGYTFFLSRIDALMTTDATLDYIVGSVKMRFKSLIWYITAVYERKRDFPRAAMTFGITIL